MGVCDLGPLQPIQDTPNEHIYIRKMVFHLAGIRIPCLLLSVIHGYINLILLVFI